MPDADGRLFAQDVAADLGISAGTWRAYVSRGQAPRPAAWVVVGAHFRPVWEPAALADYKAGRRRGIEQVDR
jgi:hypothetical protein